MASPIHAGTIMKLYFKAMGLKDMDTFSKSDPYCVLYDNNTTGGVGHLIGKTETVMNNLNPTFKTSIDVNFFFEVQQHMTLMLYDNDNKGEKGDDKLGVVKFQLSQIVTSRNMSKTFNLDTKGNVTITAIEVGSNDKNTCQMQFGGSQLKKKNFFGSTDAFYVLNRLVPPGHKTQVFKSKVITNSLNPQWELTPEIKVSRLSPGSSFDQKDIEFECYNKATFGDESMGGFVCSINDLITAADKKTSFKLFKSHKPNSFYGDIFVRVMRVKKATTFVEYLQSGWQVSLAVSIDFTGSNGDPRGRSSLHAMDPYSPNQYIRAITSVGAVLMEYDTDKKVPVFGFGASIQGQTYHFFHVNQQPDPYVSGVEGVLDAYSRFLPTCILSGPTNFAPTIRSATAGARQAEKDRCYTVLLIITDGEITDMDDTINALVEADDAPLSIVIVGVGNGCQFEAMGQLDGDGVSLRHRSGRVSRRDIVQFVPFRNYMNAPPHLLAADVLREIPTQFEAYGMLRGIAISPIQP
eukprot:Tbor_TRINITY_DN5821_c0_g2::TRINITY_DN5821_c0_g2_i1::g.7379::m.7379